MTVTPADLGTYLGAAVDDTRGQYLIDRATDLCLSIVNPLPTGSDAVLLDVAARAYLNPGNVTSQGAGPFPVAYGAVGGGLWLTRQNKATLRRLGGGGGAFSIEVAPDTPSLPWWEQNVWGATDWAGDWTQSP